MENLFLTDQEIIKIFKDHLKIESRVVSVEELFSMRNRNQIDFKPYYQRKYVWKPEKASYFVESVLIGTEIPPLIFFHGSERIEIIDGRQRYETIKNFLDNKLVLTPKGLMILKSLAKHNFDKLSTDVKNRFLDTKVRVIDFKVINEPKLDYKKEDLIKKEIFRRYNSGITPLRRAEIDKAIFIDDPITQLFKERFKKDPKFYKNLLHLFFPKRKIEGKTSLVEPLMQKIRLLCVLHMIPIRYYSTLGNRKDIMNMFYHKYSDEQDNLEEFMEDFEEKIGYLLSLRNIMGENKYNQLVGEGFFWILRVLENEEYTLNEVVTEDTISKLSESLLGNLDLFSFENHHFYKEFNQRHGFILSFFENIIIKNLKSYLDTYSAKEVRENIDMQKDGHKEEVIENQFITKPAPTDITIDSIKHKMQRDNFLVRPIYQRKEVMNFSKASSLIESILLDIKLPPLFVYKNKNSVYEVVDGQQRILAILGFIGATYKDESGTSVKTNKHNFKLRDLTIYTELLGKRFEDLDAKFQNKILDFNLSIVEIDASINPNFNPIDLFIRLNSKPYPIKPNTFESWNSWADVDIIRRIRENCKKVENWFHISKKNTRMENEELYTTLAYIDHMRNFKKEAISKTIDFHKRGEGIACRISDKKHISRLLSVMSNGEKDKQDFIQSIKNIDSMVQKLRTLLVRKDVDKDKLDAYLEQELDALFGLKSRRRLQNFYFLYPLICAVNLELIREKRHEIFSDIQQVYNAIGQVGETENEKLYFDTLSAFSDKYNLATRRIILNREQKRDLLERQKHICPVCSNALFFGEDIEVDHIKPISKGGEDNIQNMQMLHASCNRSKGVRIIIPLDKEDDSLIDPAQYLSTNESETLEFKSTLAWNLKAEMRDKKIEEAVLKTIAAFNNSKGGLLLIGVADDKTVIGLDLDYTKAGLVDSDRFHQHLRNIMKTRFTIGEGYLSKNVNIMFNASEDKSICIVKVNKGEKPIYTKDNEFYIRSGNRSVKLPIEEVVEYVKTTFNI